MNSLTRSTIPVLSLAAALTLATGCREDNYLYHSMQKPAPNYAADHQLKEMQGEDRVDILWVIDNSGSMDAHQRSVISNADLFMREFTKNGGLDWKMGLISTDEGGAPYCGLAGSPSLDKYSPDPVGIFQDAVGRLGTSGSASEMMFSPVERALTKDPNWLRKDAILAMIVVTDAPEQSSGLATSFLTFLTGLKGNGLQKVVTYAVVGPTDFGCRATDDAWEYKGSRYEELVKATRGRTFSLCTSRFGRDLSELGKDLVSRVTKPKLYLKKRPRPASIRVRYLSRLLPGGAKEDGGFWYYDFDLNALVFHDLAFAPGENESVKVTFTEDDGTQ